MNVYDIYVELILKNKITEDQVPTKFKELVSAAVNAKKTAATISDTK
jgi:hypothetical protein